MKETQTESITMWSDKLYRSHNRVSWYAGMLAGSGVTACLLDWARYF